MSPKDTRKVPLVQGQTNMGWGEDEDLTPDPTKVYICRSCFGSRVTGPIKRTVDERWVHATCLDCATRVIANVHIKTIPSQQEEPE